MKENRDMKNVRKIEENLPMKRLAKKLRFVFMVLILLCVAWFFIQFGFTRIAADNDSLEGIYAPGILVMHDRFFDYHGAGCAPSCNTENAHMKPGMCIYFKKDWNGERQEFTSQIAAIPGDTLETVSKDGSIILYIRRTGKKAELRGWKTAFPEVVPPRKFVVLNPNPDSKMPDSRDFGLLDADEISSKIVTSIGY